MRLLLFSNSTNAGEEYMAYTLPYIKDFVEEKPKRALFIPFAAVSISYDEYFQMVSEKFQQLGFELKSLHNEVDCLSSLVDADLIVVGGGNTFHLLKNLQDRDLVKTIRRKVLSGTPYIGWSAGSNLTCPTIRTTNDMPIVEPDNFNALDLIPFQINPHYTDANPEDHAGETREMRINEFIKINTNVYVAGLREGTLFSVEDNKIKFMGDKTCRIFKNGEEQVELSDNFNFLLQ